MTSIPTDEPQPTPVRFSPKLLEEFTRLVLEWTRKHHPERLTDPSEREAT